MPVPTKISYRYTFGIDDPFLGSIHLEHVAPHSSSLSSDLDGAVFSDDYYELQENIPTVAPHYGNNCEKNESRMAIQKTLGGSSFTSFLGSPSQNGVRSHLRTSTPLFSNSTNYIPKNEPDFSITELHVATSPMKNEDENPFICSTSSFSDCWKQSECREVKRPRILSETISSANEMFYQYGNDILSNVLSTEQEAAIQPTAFLTRPLEWLDERILETRKLLNDDNLNNSEENIQFSTSFIDAFIEDLDKVFQHEK